MKGKKLIIIIIIALIVVLIIIALGVKKITSSENNSKIKHLLNEKALIPRFKSFDSYYTATNVEVTPKIVGENIEFSVLDEGFENTKSFVVYKFPYDDLDFEMSFGI